MPVPLLNTTSTLPLHRVRFYDHTPSPITALAFSPLPLPLASDPKGKAKSDHAGTSNDLNTTSGGKGKDELGVLVVARENGEIELWEYAKGSEEGSLGNWIIVKTLPPTLTHPTVSQMALVIRDPIGFHQKSYIVPKIVDLRLFTAGSDSGDLTERCLITGKILQTYPIPSPPLWSLTVSPTHSLLCLTTSSPSLHFLSIPPPLSHTTSPTPLEPPPSHLLRTDTLPSRTRTVSVAWGPPKLVQSPSSEWEWRDTYLITGNSDSSFRKWQLPEPTNSGSATSNRVSLVSRAVVEKLGKHFFSKNGRKMTGTPSNKGTIVWGVGVLPDHTIVTSDSLGSVTFWDGASMAQKQTFSAHKADGMCLVIGPGGTTVFTAGPDQRVCQFTSVPSSQSSPAKWVQTSSKRIHTHDIRSLSIFPPYLPIPSSHPLSPLPVNPGLAPIIASGGWDMTVTLTPAAAPEVSSNQLRNPLGKERKGLVVFDEAFYRRLSCFVGGPGGSRICVAKEARLVVARKERSVSVWRILEEERGWEKVLDMDFRLRTNLVSSAVSQDGRWLAVSDLYETKLFELETSESDSTLHPIRIKSFLPTLLAAPLLSHLSLESRGTGSSSILFTPDSQRLVLGVVNAAEVVILELPPLDENKKRDRTVTVLKCFAKGKGDSVDGRVVLGYSRTARKDRNKSDDQHGNINGDAPSLNDDDVDMKDEESDSEVECAKKTSLDDGSWVGCMAASEDGQWLAVSDLAGQVSVYNLDTLQLHALLPTLPQSPVTLLFPPSTSLLTLVLPTQSLEFYHLEQRRFLPPTQQVNILNNTLRSQYASVEGATFEPLPSKTYTNPPTLAGYSTKSAKIVLWSHEWLLTAKLDLDLISTNKKTPITTFSKESSTSSAKSLRKKRAREAREQLEAISSVSPSISSIDLGTPGTGTGTGTGTGSGNGSGRQSSIDSLGLNSKYSQLAQQSSSLDPEFYKVTDKFKSVVSVFWLGSGEMGVVERPMSDYLGELPPAFWSGSFGRS